MSDDSDVEVKFGADTEGLEKGSEKAKEQIEKIKESLESLKESSEGVKEIFEKAFEFAGIEIGLDAFKEWVKSSAELGEQMERTGAILGITSSQASELAGMAKMTGTDFGSLEHAVERFDLGLAEATKAGSRMAEGLRVLGLSAKEFVGVPTAERLNIIAEAFSKFEDGPNKTAAAMALLGRAGAEMIPFLDKGREGMRELHDVLLRTGAVMSNEMAASFAKTMEDINEMSLAWQGLSNRIFGVVNPAIDAAIKEITKLVESMNAQSIRAGIEALTDAGIDLSAAIAEYAVRAMAAIDKLIAKLGGLRSAAQSLDTFAAAMEGDNAALVRVGKGLWGALTGADDGSKDAALAATESLDSKLKAIEKSAEAAKAKLHSMIQVVASGSPYGSLDAHAFDKPKPDVGQMKLGGGGNKDEAFKDAELEANKEIEVAKSVTTAREKELDEQLKTHQITMNQWLSQTEQALQSEYNSVKDAYDKEAAKAGLTSQQIIAMQDRINC